MTPTELGEPPPRIVLYSKPGCHLCDERNLLRERIVRLTAGCVALGGLAAVLALPLLG